MDKEMKSYAPINKQGLLYMPPNIVNDTNLKDKRIAYLPLSSAVILYDAEIKEEDLRHIVPKALNEQLDFIKEQEELLNQLREKYNKKLSS